MTAPPKLPGWTSRPSSVLPSNMAIPSSSTTCPDLAAIRAADTSANIGPFSDVPVTILPVWGLEGRQSSFCGGRLTCIWCLSTGGSHQPSSSTVAVSRLPNPEGLDAPAFAMGGSRPFGRPRFSPPALMGGGGSSSFSLPGGCPRPSHVALPPQAFLQGSSMEHPPLSSLGIRFLFPASTICIVYLGSASPNLRFSCY